jgi:PAS domain S-box-containing protein
VTEQRGSVDSELVWFFDLSLDALCIAGLDGYLRRVNPAFARMLGYTREELLAAPFMKNVHPDDRASVAAALDELAGGKDLVGFECRQLCADGSVRWFEWNTGTRPEEGEIYGVGRDVTDRHLSDAALRALHRIATLAVEGAQPLDLFTAVAEEVARVVNVPIAAVARYESDGTATECATISDGGLRPTVGTRWSLEGTNVLRLVLESCEPARIDDYSQLEGEIAAFVHHEGIRSSVGIPIVVAGRLWGAMVVSTEGELLPEGTESRLADFTELLATAIANAESREALERLADEQATLRRVATLVARAAPPEDVFTAVAAETGRLRDADLVTISRFDVDGFATVVGAWPIGGAAHPFPVGSRVKYGRKNAHTVVFPTGRPARIDDYGVDAEIAPQWGIRSVVVVPIHIAGQLWGAIGLASTRDILPAGTEMWLAGFTELVATAIANAESRSEVAASRRRIVAASDEARRRIERDLHDGMQQRLVALGLAVRAIEADVPPDMSELRSELSSVATVTAEAVAELQEISRGIHPANLSRHGLGTALRTLARRSRIPVDLELAIDERLPEPIEVAAYYVASEALANTTKHAQASHVELSLAPRNGTVLLSIRDDGVGGADPARGSGLLGLKDRVEALGGSIHVRSEPRRGTHITAELPLVIDTLEFE